MTQTFLIVDDNLFVTGAIVRVIKRSLPAATVHVADGPISARQILSTIGSVADVIVISDYDMPDGNGLDFLVSLPEHLGARLKGRILLTGGNEERKQEVESLGIRFLSKPVGNTELVATIRSFGGA